jgi:hypothetical protein
MTQVYVEQGSTAPYDQSVPILLPGPGTGGVLRPIDEPEKEGVGEYSMGCPCLCVPRTKWATSVPLTGGAAIVKIGCR